MPALILPCRCLSANRSPTPSFVPALILPWTASGRIDRATPRSNGNASAVDLAAVRDPEHQHDQPLVLDVADDPVVADPVAPQSPERMAERSAETAGIVIRLDPFGEVAKDRTLHGAIEPPQLPSGALVPLNAPCQRRPLARRESSASRA